jgi:hypothetical protein
MTIPTAAWGILIAALLTPLVQKLINLGPFYPKFPTRAYGDALRSTQSQLLDKEEFRVSIFAYMLAICFCLAGWGLVIFGIFRYIHSQSGLLPSIFLGAPIIFTGSNSIYLLADSRIVMTDSLFEYSYGKKIVRLDLKEIMAVEITETRWQGYIAITTHGPKTAKIPLYFHRGPRLYALLRSHVR